ncbi:site-specific integrase [Acidisoma sp. S159]|uniref:tyrosine-type recombinase/integrase n=1 Tax=Acidisoma sp. S159 TaxID=1747225 RepID=UPI00131D0C3B|nr:site-specific integrase [Acidisoma sp. S159]
MARIIEKLSPAKVQKVKETGIYGDGAGLYLNVGPTGGKSWVFRFMIGGKAREMGLGPLHTIGLSEARERARQCRKLQLDGIDPLEARLAKRRSARVADAKAMTFEACAETYIKSNRAGWKSEKHAAQWPATLAAYAYPKIGPIPVRAIETGHITKILETIWTTKPETASRLRGRIEAVLDYAKTHGWREGENPARWKGHLENVLPKRSKVAAVKHHAALPWAEVASFMMALEAEDGMSALALRFAILTAARTAEVLGAKWSELDFATKVWTVPSVRMKAAREHRVPLSECTLAVVREAGKMRERDCEDSFVFPGARMGKPLSNMALLMTLRRMGRSDLTAHGFRSSFRDWAAETGESADIAEAALAHVVGDKTVAAYQRGDLLERRRRLMDGWATFCRTSGSLVGIPA